MGKIVPISKTKVKRLESKFENEFYRERNKRFKY